MFKKGVNDEVYFRHVDKHRNFLQVDTSFWVYIVRRAQSAQNKFACLGNIFRKTLGDEVDFLPANKHESFLEVDSTFLDVRRQESPKYPK